MSKIDELLAQLCPNGVEYIPISELGTLTRGKRFVHADAVDRGIPCIHYGELYTYYGVSTYTTKSFVREELKDKLRYAHKNDVIIVGAGENDVDIGIAVAYLGDEDVAIHDACYILTQKNNPKYISYCLRTEYYHSQIKKYVSRGKICAISAASIGKAELPIPPLEIQDEIVHILDEYSEKIEKLCKELDAELTARKKQYEYYSSRLFLDTIAPETEMSELADFVYGYTDTAKDVGDTRFVRITDINEQGYLKQEDQKYITMTEDAKKSILRKGDIIMARTGATFGKVLYFDSDFPSVYASFLIKIIPNEKLLSRYYWHFTKTSLYWEQAKKLVTTGGQPQFNTPAVKKIRIPIPPIEEQERIVSILDRFDKLCNDISESLPAEIEARRKQYEYYRDRLFSFREC